MLRLIYIVSETNKDEDSETKENNIELKEGFLIKAIRKGNIIILDNLHEANFIIIERLNELLDSSDNFYILENPLENNIEINDKFRIIELYKIYLASIIILWHFWIIFLVINFICKSIAKSHFFIYFIKGFFFT